VWVVTVGGQRLQGLQRKRGERDAERVDQGPMIVERRWQLLWLSMRRGGRINAMGVRHEEVIGHDE